MPPGSTRFVYFSQPHNVFFRAFLQRPCCTVRVTVRCRVRQPSTASSRVVSRSGSCSGSRKRTVCLYPYRSRIANTSSRRYLSPTITFSSRELIRTEPRPKQQGPPEWARWADPEEVKAADRRLDADARWAEKVGVLRLRVCCLAHDPVTIQVLTIGATVPRTTRPTGAASGKRGYPRAAASVQPRDLPGVGARSYSTGARGDDEGMAAGRFIAVVDK